MALQQVGESTCTLGEVRNRADLVIVWGSDPVVTHPRHLERYLPKQRHLVVIDSELGRAQVAVERQLAQRQRALGQLTERLQAQHPKAQLLRNRSTLVQLEQRMTAAARMHLLQRRQALGAAGGKLDAMSPLKVLGRGYALARDAGGHVLTDSVEVAVGDAVDITLSRGALRCRVEEKQGESGPA